MMVQPILIDSAPHTAHLCSPKLSFTSKVQSHKEIRTVVNPVFFIKFGVYIKKLYVELREFAELTLIYKYK